MALSDYNPLNGNARRALARTLRLLARAVAPPPAKQEIGPAPAKQEIGPAVEGVVRKAWQAVNPQRAQRGAGKAPPQVPGAGWINLSWTYLDPDPEQQRAWASEEALYGRYTTAAGPTPQAYDTQSSVGLTVERLATIFQEASRDGWLMHKSDLDFEIAQKWGHLKTAHRQRTAAVFRNPLQLRPKSKSDLGRFVCAFVRGVLDDIPGFWKAEEDLLNAGRGGYSGLEVVWRTPRPRRVTVGRKSYTVRGAKGIEALEWVHARDFRWDPICRRMLLEVKGRFIDPFTGPDGRPTHKLIFHGADGEGDPHQRGYAYATDLLYMLSHQSLARWSVALELFGVATPYLMYDGEGYADDADVADAVEFVTAIGEGHPAVLNRKFGKLEVTPTPTGIDARGQHAAILGYLNSECSKCVAGQTLTMEIGGSGSYAAANTHSDSKEDVQIIDARLEADTQTHQTCRFIVEENAVALARASGVSPDEVIAESPIAYRVVDRRMDPKDRLMVFVGAKNDLGLSVDPDQIAEELNLRLVDSEEGDLPAPSAADPTAPPAAPPPAPQAAQRAAPFDPSKHPRADDGKFGSGAGSGGHGDEGRRGDWQPPEEGPPKLPDHAAAHLWLKEHYPHLTVSLEGMHPDLLQGHVEQIHKLSTHYPAVAREMTGLRVVPAKEFPDPGIGARTNPRTGVIKLNEAFYSDPQRLAEADRERVREGWFPAGSAAVEGSLTHEFGHLLDGWLAQQTDPKKYKKWVLDNMTMGMASDYARTNLRESIPESFRQMHHAPSSAWAPATRRLAKFLDGEEWTALGKKV